jgi:hypothetical protein
MKQQDDKVCVLILSHTFFFGNFMHSFFLVINFVHSYILLSRGSICFHFSELIVFTLLLLHAQVGFPFCACSLLFPLCFIACGVIIILRVVGNYFCITSKLYQVVFE